MLGKVQSWPVVQTSESGALFILRNANTVLFPEERHEEFDVKQSFKELKSEKLGGSSTWSGFYDLFLNSEGSLDDGLSKGRMEMHRSGSCRKTMLEAPKSIKTINKGTLVEITRIAVWH